MSLRAIVIGAAFSTMVFFSGAQVCAPELVTQLAVSGEIGAIAIDGNRVYAAAGTGGIATISLSSGTPVLLSSLATQGVANHLVHDFFERALIVADGSAGVGIYGLASDGTVSFVDSLDLGADITSIGISGTTRSYIAGSTDGRVFALALLDDALVLEGSLDLGSPVVSFNIQAPFGYIATGAGLSVIDVRKRDALEVIDSFTFGGAVSAMRQDNSVFYFGVDGVGLVSASVETDLISDGTNPDQDELVASMTVLASLSLPASAADVQARAGRLYVSMPSRGILVADSSLGQQMLLLGEASLVGVNKLELAGDTAYASMGSSGFAVLDNSSCDNFGTQLTIRYIPAGAKAEGAAGTFWVTDVAIANLSNSVATFNIAYLPQDEDNSNSVNESLVIDAGHQLVLEDVFNSLFGLGSANGALRVVTSHGDVKVTSRTYNAAGSEGTYGQFIPALDLSSSLAAGVVGALTQLKQNGSFRTNLGLVNTTAFEAVVDIELYNGVGQQVGSHSVTLQPFGMKQVNKIFNVGGAGPTNNGYAKIKVVTQDAKIFTYASVVDSGSGDPIYIPATTLLSSF